MTVVYVISALFATLLGSIVGMGGGVIIKPVMDAIKGYSAQEIGIITAVTILAMSLFSGLRQAGEKKNTSLKNILLLALGSALGGVSGQILFDYISRAGADSFVKLTQNSILLILLLAVFVYLLKKDKIKKLQLKNPPVFLFCGVMLGVVSSFLSIGGGPINVAVLMLLFSMDVKTAVFSSLVSIFFTQLAKIIVITISSGFSVFAISIIPLMAVAAIVGAFAGSFIKKNLKDRHIFALLNIVQILIILLCVYNVVYYAVKG